GPWLQIRDYEIPCVISQRLEDGVRGFLGDGDLCARDRQSRRIHHAPANRAGVALREDRETDQKGTDTLPAHQLKLLKLGIWIFHTDPSRQACAVSSLRELWVGASMVPCRLLVVKKTFGYKHPAVSERKQSAPRR